MSRSLVYLHGVGDGDPTGGWLPALNNALQLQDLPAADQSFVIAPRYDDLLSTDGVAAKMPEVTYKVRSDDRNRREFERRQARVHRRLSLEADVRAFGFNRIPDAMLSGAQRTGLKSGLDIIKQVNRYVGSDEVRGAVLRRILSHLPTSGEIVIVAHSLGSVIAIDLLDHLPSDLHVSRFVTLGSPANVESLHRGSERLLKKFPYARVDDWSNFSGLGDPITGGRGLALVFPGAQDFIIDVGKIAHSSALYLKHPAVAGLIGEMLSTRPSIAAGPPTKDLVLRISEEQENLLLGLAFGHALAAHTTDKDAAERYRSALQVVQDSAAAQLERAAVVVGRALPLEVADLSSGRPPQLSQRLEMTEAVLRLSTLAESNVIAPYEVDTGKAHLIALTDIATQLGFRPDVGKRVGEAIAEVREHTGRRGVPWGRILTGAAGLALIASGPVGLIVAAPATAFGAAAITGGLAAFGPGGMVGGMALMGGLASAGAVVATSAATVGQSEQSAVEQAGVLVIRVAAQRAMQMLDIPHDPDLWFVVTNLETMLSAQLARLRPFSDRKAPGVDDRERALYLVTSLLRFMVAKGLGPGELEAPQSRAEDEAHHAIE